MNVALMTGQLQIKSADPKLLQKLTGFSSRANKKRGFIFISKVLGKYVPCLPDDISWAQQQLAALLRPHLLANETTLVIGFAETATALGLGVYEQLALPEALYLHTSRYRLDQPLLLTFREEHSHAPEQYLYLPRDPALQARLKRVKTVLLIDDEFSTGNTLKNIIAPLRQALPQADLRFIAGGLLTWLAQPLPDVEIIALHRGQYQFSSNGATVASLGRASNTAQALDAYLPYNFGRLGLTALQLDYSAYVDARRYRNKRLLVLGTGEFLYPAYKLALYLQQQGLKTWVQSTGRSPINIDQAISSRLQFKDNYHEDVDNFLYNMRSYDVIFICYETPVLPENHQLKQQLLAFAPEVVEIKMESSI